MKLTKRNGSNMRDRKQKQQFHKLVCYNTVEALQAVSMLVRHLDSVGVKVVDEKMEYQVPHHNRKTHYRET
jgi:hypothetical protein